MGEQSRRRIGRQDGDQCVGSVPTNGRAQPAIFLMNGPGLGQQLCAHDILRIRGGQLPKHSNSALDCPAQIDGRRPRGSQLLGPRLHVCTSGWRQELVASGLGCCNRHSVGTSNADRRCTAHPQALDGLNEQVHSVADYPTLLCRQQCLIEQF